MQFTYFEIENFRGIQKIRIDLTASPISNVYTLVGLNESGKTTVLEALNHFSYKTETLEPLELPGYAIKDPHSLIPIGHRANFNGIVSIKVGFVFDPNDEDEIKKHLIKEINFTLSRPIQSLEIHQKILFKNSKFEKNQNTWTLPLFGKKKAGRKEISLLGKDWQTATNHIKTLIPSILYFPNFLFDFPDQIYLEESEDGKESEKHKFYRLVIQDILDALDNGLEVDTHVLERAKSSDKSDKDSLEALLLDMGRNVTSTVFKAWNDIFHQQMSHKRIVITGDVDASNKHFLRFQLEDVDGRYLISERSLGFRWFFVFLLLTQYRALRKGPGRNVLFLFDEPASNLHPSAQNQLLKSFTTLTKQSSKIIYTTHSHHLINPEWLEAAFVVKNEGLDYEHDAQDYSAKKTNITVTRYREFAIRHPDQTYYYKPILDVLDYAPSRLDNLPNVVMLEGKNDFYMLSYAQAIMPKPDINIHFLPGTGSSSLDSVIRLYVAWSRSFIVILDADNEGKKQKARYLEAFGPIVGNRVFTLEQIDPSWDGYEMETLLTNEEKLGIQQQSYQDDSKYNKGHFNRSVQESLVAKRKYSFSNETLEKFRLFFRFANNKLNENNGM